jgi:hypothetical protein
MKEAINMTTAMLEEETTMTDHQMDVLLDMVLTMHETLDADTFKRKIISMIKDQGIKAGFKLPPENE